MEILKEDLENLEKVDATTTMNITMGTAKEESKTLWQRLEDAEEIPEDAPLFGAKDQPVPEEVEEPKELKESCEGLKESKDVRYYSDMLYDMIEDGVVDAKSLAEDLIYWCSEDDIEHYMRVNGLMFGEDEDIDESLSSKVTLDESLFNEGISGSYFAKLATKAAEAIEDFQDAFTGLPYEFEGLIQDTEIMDLDRAVEVLYQVEGRARDLTEDVSNNELNESFVTEWWGQVEENPYDFADNYNLECEKIKDNLDSTLYRFSGSKEDIERAMGDGYFYSVWEGSDEGHSDDLNESLKESEEDDVELSDEVINDILDNVKGVFDECEFTPDEVVDKIFDCIADESKVEFAQGILDSMEEGEEKLTEGVDTFEDSLAVIKKYFNGRKASEVIDTIFTNNPAVESDKLEDIAIKLGQFLDDYLDECKLAENFI